MAMLLIAVTAARIQGAHTIDPPERFSAGLVPGVQSDRLRNWIPDLVIPRGYPLCRNKRAQWMRASSTSIRTARFPLLLDALASGGANRQPQGQSQS